MLSRYVIKILPLSFLAIFLRSVLVGGQLTEDFLTELYEKYKEAVINADDENQVSLRRRSEQSYEYKIHIKKLKEVNGLKRHNLLIKKVSRSGGSPLIYIDNPVESHIPNAFLTQDEFKELLISRARDQKFDKIKTVKKISKTTLKNQGTKQNILTKARLRWSTKKVFKEKIDLPMTTTRKIKESFNVAHIYTKLPEHHVTKTNATILNNILKVELQAGDNKGVQTIPNDIISTKLDRNTTESMIKQNKYDIGLVGPRDFKKDTGITVYIETQTEKTSTIRIAKMDNTDSESTDTIGLENKVTEEIYESDTLMVTDSVIYNTNMQTESAMNTDKLELEVTTSVEPKTTSKKNIKRTRRTLARPRVFFGRRK